MPNPCPNTSGLRNVSAPADLDGPCPRCTTGKGLHSCEDFPIPSWARGYIAAFDVEVREDALTPRYVQMTDGVLVVGPPTSDPRTAESVRRVVLLDVLRSQRRFALLRRYEAEIGRDASIVECPCGALARADHVERYGVGLAFDHNTDCQYDER